ncbi:MAG TPA: methyltransferase domain-containing protein [Geminicoccus sp.]|uniref:class I SAM-dependent methyltransferase n=1 Tax=Geminicoccus sp. TaxID=2024832 RepID=UPI002E306F2E|nr:methyltransferase domain-containing protein [Geminicoccus sp.]HEX2529223.1 methyltransferase domain-containing protein [Geminicoccus sp.]
MTSQTWNAENYRQHAGFVAVLGSPLLDLLGPVDGQDILDLGCGDGVLTEQIQARGARVVGADGSPEMVAATMAKGIPAEVADGHALPFERRFDAVFSNAALHWMTRPDDVLRSVARALRPGGRFVAEMGGAGNVAAEIVALHVAAAEFGLDARALHPWYFPSPAEQKDRLEAAGFTVRSIDLIPRPTPLPTGMLNWLRTFAGPWTEHLPADRREPFLERVEGMLAPALRDGRGHWTADYVRLRFEAVLV